MCNICESIIFITELKVVAVDSTHYKRSFSIHIKTKVVYFFPNTILISILILRTDENNNNKNNKILIISEHIERFLR